MIFRNDTNVPGVKRGRYTYQLQVNSIAGQYFFQWLKAYMLTIGAPFHRLGMVFIHLYRAATVEEGKKEGELLRALRSLVGVVALPLIAALSFLGGFVGLADVGLDYFGHMERWINGHYQLFEEGMRRSELIVSKDPCLPDCFYLAPCLQPQTLVKT